MKRLWLIVLAVALPTLGWAQAIPISGQVFNQYGNPVAGAQVYICSAAGSTGLPCSPVASIYQDYNLTIPAANPTQTDANGDFTVYAGALPFPNMYVVNAVPQSGTTYTWVVVGPTTLATLGGAPYPPGTGIPCVSTGSSWCATWNSTNLIPSSYLTAYSVIEQAGTPLAKEPALNFVANVTCTDTPGVSTNCTPSGGGGTPGGLTTQVQVNVLGAFGGYSSLTYTPTQGLVVGTIPSGQKVTVGPQSTVPISWTFDWTTPATALSSLNGAPLTGVGTSGNWPINAATATLATLANQATSLASTPPLCAIGSAPRGVNAYGNVVGCTAYAPVAVTQKNCLSVVCAGGSTYSSGVTYTNLSGLSVLEEVTMAGQGSGSTGVEYLMTTTIGGVSGPQCGITNDSWGYCSVTFKVPPGATFSATVAQHNSPGFTPTVFGWLELPD